MVFKVKSSNPFVLIELRQTKISKSALVYIKRHFDDADFMDAYLFVRFLSAQLKHPIILNYKTKLEAVRYATQYSKAKFYKLLHLARLHNLVNEEGNHLRLLSNNKDRKHFKHSKRNDYRATYNPEKFKNMELLLHYSHTQEAEANKKDQTSIEERKTSDRVNQLLRPYKPTANNNTFASARGIKKALLLRSTSQAKKVLDDFHNQGLITLTKNAAQISKGVFRALLDNKVPNIRYNKEERAYYVVFASTMKVNYTLKRTKPTKWRLMSDKDRITALDMGYTKEELNT